MKRIFASAVTSAAVLLAPSTALANSSIMPHISAQAAALIATAPQGSCVNDPAQAQCAAWQHPKGVIVASQMAGQCTLTLTRPARSGNWARAVSRMWCTHVDEQENWTRLYMFQIFTSRTFGLAGVSKHMGHIGYPNGASQSWATVWSKCTGGWGTDTTLRPWRSDGIGAVDRHGFWTFLPVHEEFASIKCIHNM